ncbi:hypothetical protein E2320_010571, partial [Naja naja]
MGKQHHYLCVEEERGRKERVWGTQGPSACQCAMGSSSHGRSQAVMALGRRSGKQTMVASQRCDNGEENIVRSFGLKKRSMAKKEFVLSLQPSSTEVFLLHCQPSLLILGASCAHARGGGSVDLRMAVSGATTSMPAHWPFLGPSCLHMGKQHHYLCVEEERGRKERVWGTQGPSACQCAMGSSSHGRSQAVMALGRRSGKQTVACGFGIAAGRGRKQNCPLALGMEATERR